MESRPGSHSPRGLVPASSLRLVPPRAQWPLETCPRPLLLTLHSRPHGFPALFPTVLWFPHLQTSAPGVGGGPLPPLPRTPPSIVRVPAGLAAAPGSPSANAEAAAPQAGFMSSAVGAARESLRYPNGSPGMEALTFSPVFTRGASGPERLDNFPTVTQGIEEAESRDKLWPFPLLPWASSAGWAGRVPRGLGRLAGCSVDGLVDGIAERLWAVPSPGAPVVPSAVCREPLSACGSQGPELTPARPLSTRGLSAGPLTSLSLRVHSGKGRAALPAR